MRAPTRGSASKTGLRDRRSRGRRHLAIHADDGWRRHPPARQQRPQRSAESEPDRPRCSCDRRTPPRSVHIHAAVCGGRRPRVTRWRGGRAIQRGNVVVHGAPRAMRSPTTTLASAPETVSSTLPSVVTSPVWFPRLASVTETAPPSSSRLVNVRTKSAAPQDTMMSNALSGAVAHRQKITVHL